MTVNESDSYHRQLRWASTAACCVVFANTKHSSMRMRKHVNIFTCLEFTTRNEVHTLRRSDTIAIMFSKKTLLRIRMSKTTLNSWPPLKSTLWGVDRGPLGGPRGVWGGPRVPPPGVWAQTPFFVCIQKTSQKWLNIESFSKNVLFGVCLETPFFVLWVREPKTETAQKWTESVHFLTVLGIRWSKQGRDPVLTPNTHFRGIWGVESKKQVIFDTFFDTQRTVSGVAGGWIQKTSHFLTRFLTSNDSKYPKTGMELPHLGAFQV